MGKYSVDNIVGEPRTLANGAVAGYVMVDGKKVWRIISGANDMSAARSAPRRRTLSQKAAVRAFNAHYKNKAYKTEAARKAAMTRDLCSSNQPRKSTTSYRRSPHKYDFAGVDDGSRCPKGKTVRGKRQPTEKQLQALARGRAARAANLRGGARGRPKGSRNKVQKHCGFNDETMRCSKAANGKNNEWCTVGRKSKRCKKSTRGKSSAPKRVPSQKQLDALARGRAVRDANRMRGGFGQVDTSQCNRYPGPPPHRTPLHSWNVRALNDFKREWQDACCGEYPGPPPTKSPLHQHNSRELEAFRAQWEADCNADPNEAWKDYEFGEDLEGGKRGRKRGSKNKVQRQCGLNEETMRCSKSANGNKNELCTVGRKSGRCKKSTAGKASDAHKNPANVARGKALMANLRETGRVARRAKKASPKRRRGRPSKAMKHTSHEARLGKKGSACRGLSKSDCEKHPACDFRKFGKAKSPSCGRKRQ